MSAWDLVTAEETRDPTDPFDARLDPYWVEVPSFSDLDVNRLDLEAGVRHRFANGWGVELSGVRTKYVDDAPILEDESGEYYAITTLFSKSF